MTNHDMLIGALNEGMDGVKKRLGKLENKMDEVLAAVNHSRGMEKIKNALIAFGSGLFASILTK